jgi:hypothetical protein
MYPAAMSQGEENFWGWVVGSVPIALLLAFVVLFLAALVSILGSPLTGGMKLVWVGFAFCAPFLGSLLWFVFGRRDAYLRERR